MIAPYATLAEMAAWAAMTMRREPDFVIGDNYLRRWWSIPRNEGCNIYLHEILQSDDDRALHDHPWDHTSMLIEGSYIEHTPNGSFLREAGSIVSRPATASHRLEIPEGGRAVSLFMTGPKGWRHWTEFVDVRDSGQVGKGCAD